MNFYYDQGKNLLVYPLSRYAPISALPEAQVNGEYFAVPFTLPNCQILRFWNYPVPEIMRDYDWPINSRFKPLAHQKLMSNFMVLHPRCFNLSDMGTMKTLAALWSADFLMRRMPGTKALVVCPLSIMERVWGKAVFEHFFSRRTYEVLYGSHSKRKETLEKTKADFIIVNYDGVGLGARVHGRFELGGLSQALSERSDIGITIVDEASAYRDARTRRHRIARQVFGSRPYLWLLTGTPTPNAPTDAYGISKIVNNAHGKSFTTFQLETMHKISQWKWAPKKDGYAQAGRLLSPSIRFALEDVWDGPELTTQQRQVELTSEQNKLLKELKRDLVIKMRNNELVSATNEAAARTKYLQVVLGAVYDHTHKEHIIDSSPRINELKAVVAEAPGKILIFAGLTSVVRMLYKALEGQEREMVYGDTPLKERTRIFSDFQQDRSPRILLADPGCMAHGLDLWQARTVVWYGPTDKSELYAQANRRAYRPGQRFPVTVVQLASTALEREIFRRIENNLSAQGALLDMLKKDQL